MSAFVNKHSVLLLVVLVILVHTGNGAPSSLEYACKYDSQVDTTCQRCAKLTKSHIVYPMCCYNDENVHTWCVNYISYGQHE